MQFPVDVYLVDTYRLPRKTGCQLLCMNSVVNFVELENRVISATYRNLMVRAKVVLVDKASGRQLSDPVTTITSPLPNGTLRIRLPDQIQSGTYFLRALNAHGDDVAHSAEFQVG
jgi:hypothetical protein